MIHLRLVLERRLPKREIIERSIIGKAEFEVTFQLSATIVKEVIVQQHAGTETINPDVDLHTFQWQFIAITNLEPDALIPADELTHEHIEQRVTRALGLSHRGDVDDALDVAEEAAELAAS